MKEAKVVIGANFGDEGKGLMTDYFCSKFPSTKPVLNVRFNGGAQAGHTVVSPDGRRHIFSHFGSGSFLPNVATYLASDFIVNPILFRREYEKLEKLGIYPMVYANPRCIFTMPQDMMVNQFIETRRGIDRHGSCGVGIYETILRNENDKRKRLEDMKYSIARYQIDIGYYESERIEKLFNVSLLDKEKHLLSNQNIRAHFNQDMKFFMDHVSIVDDSIFSRFDYVVFEGGQGLMLDQNNIDYFPHLTPSNTGTKNIVNYFAGLIDNPELEICYVTRPYLTRHGAGRLDGECTREELGVKPDLTNIENTWQGSLRYGRIDFDDLRNRIELDSDNLWEKDIPASISLAVTHLDEIDEKRFFEESTTISKYIKYCSYGATRRAITLYAR